MYSRNSAWLLIAAVLITPRVRAAGEPTASYASDYVLQPFDLIQIVIFQEPNLERQVRLSQESIVSLPLIGPVDLKQKTVRDAQALIRDLYNRDYLVNPQINITVLEYSKVAVNVLGSVNNPGTVVIPPDRGLKLLEAIAQVGGFSRLADRKHVKLSRTDAEGKTSTFTINADDIIQSTSGDNWPLQKSDVIFVPEKLL